VNMLSLEVGTNAEHRAGSPLTLAAMAGDHGIGVGGYFDTQGTATAMRGSRHSTPPSSSVARLQESRHQSDPLLSIVLLAPVCLAQLPKSLSGGPSRHCNGGLAVCPFGPGNEAAPQQSCGAAVTTGLCRADRESSERSGCCDARRLQSINSKSIMAGRRSFISRSTSDVSARIWSTSAEIV
jgi:hypothetical protein